MTKNPSRLLVEIAYEEAQDESPVFLDCDPDEVEYMCTTFWKGLVSGRTYVCESEGLLPTREFFRAAEAKELFALEKQHIGAMQ